MVNKKYSDDGKMWEEVMAGSANAAEQMFCRHRGLAKLFLSKRKVFIPNYDDEDLVAEMEIAIWKSVLKYDHRKGFSFSTYAFGAMKRQVADLITASKKQPATTRLFSSEHSEPYEDVDMDVDIDIDALPEQDRNIAIAIISGKRSGEIISDLGISRRGLAKSKKNIASKMVLATINQ